MAVNWNYFDKFDEIIAKYMPAIGEGETVAAQAVTAVNKLVYKWYNDGDVFDNTHHLEGWANDLSSYANWLVKYTDKAGCLYSISDITSEGEYEDLLKELADAVLDPDWLKTMEKSAEGSIYHCDGPFKFEEYGFDDEEEEY